MAKHDIDFVLLDESVVDHGYRCLMSGAELDDFKANPVMLYLHLRGNDGWEKPTDEVLLPIGIWYDIRVEGGRLMAKPDFDDDDDFAQRIEKKVKKGYLRAASVWIDPIAVSDDEALQVKGQRGPTITQWGVRESSIVDIPGCRNAIAMRNSAGKLLKLSSKDNTNQAEVLEYLTSLLPQKNNSEMDRKLLALKLGLPETATDADIDAKLTATLSAAKPNTQLSTENTSLKEQLQKLKDDQQTAKIEGLVDGAIKDLKLSAAERPDYIKLATADYDTTKKLIDAMKPFEGAEGKLKTGGSNTEAEKAELAELMKLSGRDLYMQGKFSRLQKLSADGFKAKYKEYYGTDYKEKA